MAFLNYENRRGSGKKLKVHFDLPEDDDSRGSSHQKHSRRSSISSDSSLESDSDTEKDDNSIDNFESKYAGTGYPSPVWSYQSGSVTQSPPIQLMSSPGYDPNRIPLSVFSSHPSPIEWSVASNESLFSIHIGNNSFSRDHVFAFNNKSGELPRTNDLVTTLPTVQEVQHDKHVDMETHSVSTDTSSEENADSVAVNDFKTNETSAEINTIVMDKKTPEDHSKEAMIPSEEAKNRTSTSYRSVESDISIQSFQFPILAVEAGRTSSATAESERQQPEKQSQPPSPETETAPPPPQRRGGMNWCYCFSCCSPCY